MADIFCPVHTEVQDNLKEMRAKQEARHCLSHAAEIGNLKDDMGEMKQDNKDQWTAINSLRRMVYMGAGATGVLAFLGSVIGGMLKR